MKKLNLKQPKYIFPLVIFLPLTFVVYEVTNVFGGNKTSSVVATDSLNMSLPDAQNEEMKDKLAMAGQSGDAATAVEGFDKDEEDMDTTGTGYSESELDNIDKQNAERKAQEDQRRELERSLAESSRHINSYANSGSGSYGGGSRTSRRNEIDDYAKELEYIQKRSRAAQRAIDRDSYSDSGYGGGSNGYGSGGGSYGNSGYTYDIYGNPVPARSSSRIKNGRGKKKEEKIEIVKKVQSKNADKFNTVSAKENLDAPLIRAMIDKTTKAHEGTRLRFKLLDDVTIKGTLLKKGTYLYGLVTGFGSQRVRAQITSILIKNKFIKVNLSVFDNDGMEGFYVPESAFRDMMKEAGSQALGQNMNFDNGYSSALTGESVALQAIQNAYQSVTSAVSANIRKNKARIKYNTIVYLVNTEADN